MRLWSLHPKYLDAKGLVALWREGLLAQAVLAGKTRGYKNHPQLLRFRAQETPLEAIGTYLLAVCDEGRRRGYRFDCGKIISRGGKGAKIQVAEGQAEFEFSHLKKKLEKRDVERFSLLMKLKKPKPHPMFAIRKGGIEKWEKA